MQKYLALLAGPFCAAMLAIGCAAGPRAADRAPISKNASEQASPGISLEPAGARLAGDLSEITLVGATPGGMVELTAERSIASRIPGVPRQLFRATAQFQVDAAGKVALSRSAPRTGSYQGADLRGLFWSMTATRDAIPANADDDHARLVARQDGRQLAEVQVPLPNVLPEVEVAPVGPALPGAVLARLPTPPATRRPAIILLGGSEGGDWVAREFAPRLASHGYAVLGLPYYAPRYGGAPGNPALASLPTAFVDIPVDRLDQARDWLRHAPGVDGDHIALYGVSKGAEFVLIAASRMTWPAAIVALVPSDVVWEGWGLPDQVAGARSSFSWHGEPLPFVPYDGMTAELAKLGTTTPAQLRVPHERGRAAHPEAIGRARIPVERYPGPLLIAGSGDDNVWPSGAMTENLARTRRAAGRPTTVLLFPDAGHAISGAGWSPLPTFGGMSLGGTPASNARAQAATWGATLDFLARSLPRP